MTSSTDPKGILLRGEGRQREALSAVALTPGMLANLNSAGKLILPLHGGLAAYVVKEHDWTGKGIDDVFASGDQVPYYVAQKGDQFYGWQKDGVAVTAGALLMAHTDGSLQPVTSGGTPVARALQTQDTTGGAAVIARLKVEIL
jgi:hypothetical protein